MVPGATSYQKLAMKQGDPEEKQGLVGAFCRTYNVLAAMDAYLPGIYEAVDNDPDRYTYLGGSTTAARSSMTAASSCSATTRRTRAAGGWSTPLI